MKDCAAPLPSEPCGVEPSDSEPLDCEVERFRSLSRLEVQQVLLNLVREEHLFPFRMFSFFTSLSIKTSESRKTSFGCVGVASVCLLWAWSLTPGVFLQVSNTSGR